MVALRDLRDTTPKTYQAQELWLKAKVQDHSKALNLKKYPNNTDVLWLQKLGRDWGGGRERTCKSPTKNKSREGGAPEAGIWVGPGKLEGSPQQTVPGPGIVTHHPQHCRDPPSKEKLLSCPHPGHSLPEYPISMSWTYGLKAWHDSHGGRRRFRPGPRDQVLTLS